MLDVNLSESYIIVSLNPKLTDGYDPTEQEQGRRKSSRRGKKRKQTMVWSRSNEQILDERMVPE